MQSLATTLLDLLLPAVCPLCRVASGPDACASCRAAVATCEIPHPCPWCGAERLDPALPCARCGDAGIPHLDRVVVRFFYSGALERLIGDAKAGARNGAVRGCTAFLPTLPNDLPQPAPGLVVPIPPAPGRRPGRHLATALARHLAAAMHLPMRSCLRMTRLAAEQHLLSPSERRRNVHDLFQCPQPMPNHVILVDDLITLGATASAAASALRSAGARKITAVFLASTPRDAERRRIAERQQNSVAAS